MTIPPKRSLKAVVLFFLLFAFPFAGAQQPLPVPEEFFPPQMLECGKPEAKPEVIRYLHEVVRQTAIDRNAGTTCVPLKIHIVRQSDGTGGISLTDVNQAIANLNYYFFEAGTPMEFYLCDPIQYIDNSAWYDFDMTEEAALCDPNDVNNAMNLYFVNQICITAGNNCGIAGYAYFPFNNIQSTRSLLRNDQMVLYANGTFVHELGHNFSLEHTHVGTENGPNDPDAERVVRTPPDANCTVRSDDLCDTDADPRYDPAYFNLVTCTYTGSQTDDQGNVYTPPVDNIMSYYPDQCGGIFTAGQLTQLGQGLTTRQGHTAYTLDCAAATVSNPSGLTATITNNYTIQLNWTDNANNETGYLIERSETSASAGFRAVKFGGTGPDATVFEDKNLTANTDYWYRVKASNDDCNDYSNVVNINSGLLYCIPSVQADNCTQNGFGIGIGRFTIDDGSNTLLDNDNDACNGPLSVYSSTHTAAVAAGATYNYTIELLTNTGGPSGSYYPQNYAIWMDANQDGDFDDAGELLVQSNLNPCEGIVLTGTFTIPSGALAGTTSLRVRTRFCSNGLVSSPCAYYSFGEAEDYGLQVSSPLPVSWLSFAARQRGEAVELNWATATEVNTAYFAVERSQDGVVFEEVGRREAAAYSLSRQDYDYLDKNPPAGLLYYRLSQVDGDGEYAYSPVRAVRFVPEHAVLRVYPNPSDGTFTFELPAGLHALWFALYDARGSLLRKAALQGSKGRLSGLLPGVYLLRVQAKNREYLQRIVVY